MAESLFGGIGLGIYFKAPYQTDENKSNGRKENQKLAFELLAAEDIPELADKQQIV